MLILLSTLASATSMAGLTVWSGPEVRRDEVVYAVGADCVDVVVVDEQAAPVAFTCEVLGDVDGEPLLLLSADGDWPVGTFEVGLVGTARTVLTRLDTEAVSGVVAVPVGRTATENGVSYQVCHDGVVAAVVLAETEPLDALDAAFLAPDVGDVHFGVEGGRWPSAAPRAEQGFWFTTYDALGGNPGWTEDVVTLASAGKVRVDVRVGFDPSGGGCPLPGANWLLGEELDAMGGPVTPGDDNRGQDAPKRGCDQGGAAGGSWALLALLGLRRRYQSS